MRLGDLAALKQAIDENAEDIFGIEDVIDYIDNAPTVIVDWEKSDAYLDCIKRIKSLEKENDELRQFLKANFERPQGKWVRTGQSFINPNKFRNFCCSNCFWELDEHIRIEPNFCPNCGADMRGDNNGKSSS